ncbi:hypothetical protein CTI12_AA503740 [Artemisia annua]|uniref:Uncharacterized protein n=1 Tax=Artemisia annua TaxID=35608 RepID=A0A2U1LDJ4_ARTAN|nr:hypothetical protein CTI12_AA503740 [Artemisia annua]
MGEKWVSFAPPTGVEFGSEMSNVMKSELMLNRRYKYPGWLIETACSFSSYVCLPQLYKRTIRAPHASAVNIKPAPSMAAFFPSGPIAIAPEILSFGLSTPNLLHCDSKQQTLSVGVKKRSNCYVRGRGKGRMNARGNMLKCEAICYEKAGYRHCKSLSLRS